MTDLEEMHAGSFGNRADVERSERCGCFQCLRQFARVEVEQWHREWDGSDTALCPWCGIDSLVCDADGERVDAEILAALRDRFFGSLSR